MDRGESLEAALRREMKEELGIDVSKTESVGFGYHNASDGERQRIHYFHVKEWEGTIRPNEAEKLYWETNVSHLTAMADRNAVKKLL